MIHTWAYRAMVAAIGMMGACGPEITVVKNCAGVIVEQVLVRNTPSPTPENPQPVQQMDCSFLAEPADISGRAPYSVNGLGVVNGWEWYQACPVAAKQLGYTIPARKITGDANDSSMNPRLVFFIDTAPILGRGSGHYSDMFNAGNMAVWRRSYVVGVAP